MALLRRYLSASPPCNACARQYGMQAAHVSIRFEAGSSQLEQLPELVSRYQHDTCLYTQSYRGHVVMLAVLSMMFSLSVVM